MRRSLVMVGILLRTGPDGLLGTVLRFSANLTFVTIAVVERILAIHRRFCLSKLICTSGLHALIFGMVANGLGSQRRSVRLCVLAPVVAGRIPGAGEPP